jgi:hypothetical protein
MGNHGNRNHETWNGRHPHGRFWAERRYGQGFVGTGWTAFAPGWGEMGPSYEAPVAVDATIPRLRLPTAEDLPIAGQIRSPVGEPVLYTIRDLSHGRSGRLFGARIVSASKPTPLPGSSPSGDPVRGGPLIIHLTAR